jgi:phage shock protein PspC (stress-responsive transcriptional regulator)
MTTTPPDAPAGPPPADQGAPSGPPGPAPTAGPRTTREELKELGRISRTTGPDRKVAGVAGGLARHLDIDPVLLRVAFVVLVFFGGAGVIAYGLAWILLPQDGNPRRPLGLDDRNRGIALIGVGVLAGLALLSDTFGNDFFPWPVAIVIGLVVFFVVGVLDRDRRVTPSAPPVPHRPDPVTGQFVPAAPGSYVTPPVAPHRLPRNPRRRGPILFWFTLALATLGIGVLSVVDLAGGPVAPSAYPAMVVGVCGVMLLVGAFYGRAGGLILVGLVAALGLASATVAQRVDGEDITRTPTTAATVPTHLGTSAGEIVLDLTEVQDVSALDGRTVDLTADVGRLVVIVPPGLTVSVDATIDGPGHLELFRDERGGINIDDQVRHTAGIGAPELDVSAHLSVGEIKVYEEALP